MYRLKRFNVLKTSTVVAVIYMVVVAIIVVPLALVVAIAGTASQVQGGVAGAIIFGVVAIFGYGLLGWVFTAIACLAYNAVSSWIGGIEIQVEPIAPPQPPPAWMNPNAAPPAPPTPPATPPNTPPNPPATV